jgi:hypothetical protein
MKAKKGYIFHETVIGLLVGIVTISIGTYGIGLVLQKQKNVFKRAQVLQEAIATVEMIHKNPATLFSSSTHATNPSISISVTAEKAVVPGMESTSIPYYRATVVSTDGSATVQLSTTVVCYDYEGD